MKKEEDICAHEGFPYAKLRKMIVQNKILPYSLESRIVFILIINQTSLLQQLNTWGEVSKMNKKWLWILIGITVCFTILSGPVAMGAGYAIAADDKDDAQQLVDGARHALQNFMKDPNMGIMRDLLKKAKGVFIMPQLLRGAFVVGASGGSGVFLQRQSDNKWSNPAFYTVGGASIGLQIGGEASEVILLIMTDRGNSAFQSTNFKLGSDAGIAVGPVGAGVSAQTANLSADILSFSRSKGLYGGVSLQGAVVATRESLNTAYYGKAVKPPDILVKGTAKNPQAAVLVNELARDAKAK